jgi:type IV secretory pathway VirB3-like protein
MLENTTNLNYEGLHIETLGTYRDENFISLFIKHLENASHSRTSKIYSIQALGNYLN